MEEGPTYRGPALCPIARHSCRTRNDAADWISLWSRRSSDQIAQTAHEPSGERIKLRHDQHVSRIKNDMIGEKEGALKVFSLARIGPVATQ